MLPLRIEQNKYNTADISLQQQRATEVSKPREAMVPTGDSSEEGSWHCTAAFPLGSAAHSGLRKRVEVLRADPCWVQRNWWSF